MEAFLNDTSQCALLLSHVNGITQKVFFCDKKERAQLSWEEFILSFFSE